MKIEKIDWEELSRRGLVRRINVEILHPIGLAVFWDTETKISDGAFISPDGEFCYPPEDKLS